MTLRSSDTKVSGQLSRLEHAELVACRVGQHDPGDIALSHVDMRCPEPEEALYLCFLVR